MKKKIAIRPIERRSAQGGRPLEAVRPSCRAYPDARTLALAIREAAARAMRVVALPAVGLVSGCGGDALQPLPFAPALSVEVGTVVEGLRVPVPATQIVPLDPGRVPARIEAPVPPFPNLTPRGGPPPVRPDEIPPSPPGDSAAVLPDPTPPQVDGEPPAVAPTPPPPPDLDAPALPGRPSNVRAHPVPVPAGMRAAGPPVTRAEPVPRALSDAALAAALESIR